MAEPARPDGQQPAIADYAFLSDCHSGALVDRSGSVDWWCLPRFDSPSVFGRLLDPAAGHWTLQPVGDFSCERSYVADTLVLRTVFHTVTGSVSVTDALLLEPGARGHDIGLRSPHVLHRRLEGQWGTVRIRTDLSPRMEYGRTEPHFRTFSGGAQAAGGPVTLTLSTEVPLRLDDGAILGEFDVAAGQVVDLRLSYAPTFGQPPDLAGEPSPEDTVDGWASWTAQHTGYDGDYPEQVRRSSLVLQGLTYGPSGAVLAAATTSLPETIGGSDNFDYRYAWLRDLSLTIRSLWLAACPDEPGRLFGWLAGSAGHVRDELVQIMYGVEGERDLTEHVLEHLGGYRGSTPVRVGNAAWEQDQLDVYGEVLDAAHLMRDQLSQFEPPTQQLLVALANRAARTWEQPDAGMWEARDQQRHYTSSKVMCWVALDRAVDLASCLGADADPDRWATARDAVRDAVLDQAWSEQAGAYTGAFGSDDLDASVLVLPLVGFLPADDDRMRATIEAVERELGEGGLVRRWPSDRSGFLICTFWLVECLVLAGRPVSARAWFRNATEHANDLGLLSEEADVRTGEMLGNYPQAFSHVGLINAAWRLGQPTTDTP
ncbi:MAG: glycoside hydrolase family 15 protein [Geodermatophilaceae bacterium]|nr:glycoside hydrolase family 15 protein [Geodermatophilaceae bacterium]MDQ3477234.1 glycoside hydrolase family 15 protein [Actinomycetota bacterium]